MRLPTREWGAEGDMAAPVAAFDNALAELGSVDLLSPAFNEFLVLYDWLEAGRSGAIKNRARKDGEQS